MYGCVFEVSDSDSIVRPWNPPSKPITAGPTRVRARELDGVLDGFGAGVEERRLRRAAERREREQPFGELCVDLVGDDRVVGVREPLELLLRRRDDARMRVADVQAADAAGEVDEDVPVDVGDRRATRLGGDDRERQIERRRHAGTQPIEHVARARAWNVGDDRARRGSLPWSSEGSESPRRPQRWLDPERPAFASLPPVPRATMPTVQTEPNANTWWSESHAADRDFLVAYFSMEFGVEARLPIYSGGLGVLAGDYLKAAAELGLPLVGVGLLYRDGYFRQPLDASGRQVESREGFDPGRLRARARAGRGPASSWPASRSR